MMNVTVLGLLSELAKDEPRIERRSQQGQRADGGKIENGSKYVHAGDN